MYSVITDVYKPIPERLKDWWPHPKAMVTNHFAHYCHWSQRKICRSSDPFRTNGWNCREGICCALEVQRSKIAGKRLWFMARQCKGYSGYTAFQCPEFSMILRPTSSAKSLCVYTQRGYEDPAYRATALILPSDIHTELGYRATAIKVNNKLVPMGYKLNNGDQIQITTSKKSKANRRMAQDGGNRARSKIRSSMKEETKRGRIWQRSFRRKLKNMKIDFEEKCRFSCQTIWF